MPRKLCLVSIVIVAAIVAAGCGSSSSTPTRKSLVAAADPICKRVSVKRNAANEAVTKAGSQAKELQVLARLAPGIAEEEHEAVAKLRSLKAPAKLANDWKAMLKGLQELANYTTEIAAHAKANNLKAVEAVTSSGQTVRLQLTVIASRDGFAYCGRTG
jgi:hypothetical protein